MSRIRQNILSWWRRIRWIVGRWWRGRYVDFEYDPDWPDDVRPEGYDRHWTADRARAVLSFLRREWFKVGTLALMAGALIVAMIGLS